MGGGPQLASPEFEFEAEEQPRWSIALTLPEAVDARNVAPDGWLRGAEYTALDAGTTLEAAVLDVTAQRMQDATGARETGRNVG